MERERPKLADSGRLLRGIADQEIFTSYLPPIVGKVYADPLPEPAFIEQDDAVWAEEDMYQAAKSILLFGRKKLLDKIHEELKYSGRGEEASALRNVYGFVSSTWSFDTHYYWNKLLKGGLTKISAARGLRELFKIWIPKRSIDDPLLREKYHLMLAVPYQLTVSFIPNLIDTEAQIIFGKHRTSSPTANDVYKYATNPDLIPQF